MVAARSREQANHLCAISPKDQYQSAALHRQFRARLQVVEAGDDFGEIAGAAVFVIVGEDARGAVAMINQGNLHRLTDDLDRQGLTPCTEYPTAARELQ